MSHFVKKILQEKEDNIPSYKKSAAYLIDNIILFTIRYFVFILCYFLWFGQSFQRFSVEVQEKFYISGIAKQGAAKQVEQYFLNHIILWDVIFIAILMVIIGMIYYSYSFASKHSATFGMRIMKLKLVSTNEKELSFLRIITRHILGLIPWVTYAISWFVISSGEYRLGFMVLLIAYIWYRPNLLGKSKKAIHDIICKTVWIKV